jgi:sugar O-acyltransferase (sialic acid O-acetyltransferase NeuD family)
MLIIGAKGFAKEVLEVFHQLKELENIAFYDDVNKNIGGFLFDKFPILKNENQIIDHFQKYGNKFTIAIGKPSLRYQFYEKLIQLGGVYSSSISPFASIGSYDVAIGSGSNILANVSISNSVHIGIGCILYYNVIVAHDSKIGDFVELSPSATLLGRVEIGSFTHIGANATILPDIKIGSNVIIGAGALVTKDVPDNVLVYGVPAKIIKKIE